MRMMAGRLRGTGALTIIGALAFLCLAACQPKAPADPVPPHDSLTIESGALGENRTINVYMPPGYADGAETYRVLYMPDGGVKEDFPHIANTVDELIREGAIAPVLVVGIENTERRRDLSPNSSTEADGELAPMDDGASVFRTFISMELIPEIESRYRVQPGRAIVGESLAGLFVVDTLMREPDLFDRYIAMDPSLWWDDHELVKRAPERLAGLAGKERVFWMSASGANDIMPHTEALAEALKANAPADLIWTFEPRPKERHNTIFRATKEQAFREALWPTGSDPAR
ncbi:MAG: alpha/beta hydrolase-fold protein [Hyphomonadaceae bacterium]